MSKFYGQVEGASDKIVTRRGHRGIITAAQSYDGSVQTYLYYNDDKKLCVRIGLSDCSRFTPDEIVFNGTFEDFKKKFD